MKIAVWHNLKSGGGNRALQQQIRGLALRGHQIEIWSNDGADNSFPDLKDLAPKLHLLELKTYIRFREQYRDGLSALFFGKDQHIKNMEAHSKACAEQINAGKFDVVLVHSCNQFFMPHIGQFINATPKVLYLHEPNRVLIEAWPDKLCWEAPAETKRWSALKADFFDQRQKRVWLRHERANYFTYDAVLVNSYFSNESLVRAYGQRGRVCYLGINEAEFPFLNLKREPFVLGLGTYYRHKGIDTAIEAVATIPAKMRPKLVWIGNDGGGGYYDAMVELAKQRGVVFEPQKNLSQTELVKILNTATCLIYTSRLEPFGYAPLEANACGLPVVAVAEGGVRETVIDGHNGIVTERDPVLLGAALQAVLNNTDLFEELLANARNWVKNKWSFEASIDRIEAALQAAAGRGVEERNAQAESLKQPIL